MLGLVSWFIASLALLPVLLRWWPLKEPAMAKTTPAVVQAAEWVSE
jgi:hypothetical protein